MKMIIIPSCDNLDSYLDYSSNFIFPLDNFSVDYKKTYTLDEVISFKDKYNINAYVIINKPIFNKDLKEVEELLKKIDDSNISGILFYDMSILEIHNKYSLNTPIIWNDTHKVVNYKTCDYYKDKGCSCCVLSNEITKEEIFDIIKNTNIKVWMMVVGYPIMAFSHRKLLTSHSVYHKLDKTCDLKVSEHASKKVYDVFENEFGTSFRKDEIMNLTSILDDIDIDGIIFKEEDIDKEIFIKVLSSYKKYFDGNISFDELVSLVNSLIGCDTNFLDKETYYEVR